MDPWPDLPQDNGSADWCSCAAAVLELRVARLREERALRYAAGHLAPLLLAVRTLQRSPAFRGGTAALQPEACARLVRACCVAAFSGGGPTCRVDMDRRWWESVGAERVYTEFFVAGSRDPPPGGGQCLLVDAADVAARFVPEAREGWRPRYLARGAAACHLALMRAATRGSAALAHDLMGVVLGFLDGAWYAPFVVAAGYSGLPVGEAVACAALHDVLETAGSRHGALELVAATSVPLLARAPALGAEVRTYALDVTTGGTVPVELFGAIGAAWAEGRWLFRARPALVSAYRAGGVLAPWAFDGPYSGPVCLHPPGTDPAVARAVRRWEAGAVDAATARREIELAVAAVLRRAAADDPPKEKPRKRRRTTRDGGSKGDATGPGV